MNGDDPEAVVHAARIAIEFRQAFGSDVVLDIFCYRRFGHNEGDEPMFTQPLMYKTISEHPTTSSIYAEKLVAEGIMKPEETRQVVDDRIAYLDTEFEAGTNYRPNKADWLEGSWSGMRTAHGIERRGDTAVELETLRKIGETMTTVPEHMTLNPLSLIHI